MSPKTDQLIRRVHDSPTRIVLALSGGGSRAIAQLLEMPGASRTVLEVSVPYSEPAVIQWLGARPDQFCSEPTARAMAMAAYLRACRYEPEKGTGTFCAKHPTAPLAVPFGLSGKRCLSPFPLAGVASTASLATDRPKRGPHRAHLAIQTAAMTVSQSIELEKGRRSRAEEEALVACLVLNAVARACDVAQRLDPGLLGQERVEEAAMVAPQPWQDLLAGRVESVEQSGPALAPGRRARLVFPGAFHPLHVGHRRMAEIARSRFAQPVEFEISTVNVDKPPLDFLEIRQRAAQFPSDQTLWLTRAATFEEKSRVFPGATFLVGTDTLRRIADPRYYGNDPAACLRAIEQIAARACRFLVFGRQHEGRFVRLSDLDLPAQARALCQEVPEFREDICSTDVRLAADPGRQD